MIKHIVALNLALSIFGGTAHQEVTSPTLEKNNEVVEEYKAIKHSADIDYSNQEEDDRIKSLGDAISAVEKAKYALNVETEKLISEPHTIINIVLDEKNDFGYYFLDENAEVEPLIYVDYEMLEHWGVDDMKVGDRIDGIFDADGWELYGFIKVDEENVD